MLLTMRRISLQLACVACVCNAFRVNISSDRLQQDPSPRSQLPVKTVIGRDHLRKGKAIAMLLFALKPVTAFSPATPGTHTAWGIPSFASSRTLARDGQRHLAADSHRSREISMMRGSKPQGRSYGCRGGRRGRGGRGVAGSSRSLPAGLDLGSCRGGRGSAEQTWSQDSFDEEMLEIGRRDLIKKQHTDVLNALNRYANSLSELGRRADSIEASRRAFGSELKGTVEALNAYAATLNSGQIAEAEAMKAKVFQLRRQVVSGGMAMMMASPVGSAVARNLPEATGSSGKLQGSLEALVPIVRASKMVSSAVSVVPDLKAVSHALEGLPTVEKEFKRLFDEYSQGLSYKQQYLDKNAFLVYYTKGFDGVGRESIETESAGETKQKAQYGFRNEAWLGVKDACDEVKFLQANPPKEDDDFKELRDALGRAQVAFSSYLSLAPTEQVTAAQELVSR